MEPAGWTIRFKGYLPIDDQMETRLRRVIAEIDSLPDGALHIDRVNRVITIDYSQVRGWLEASREVLHAVRAGEHIVVKPPWETFDVTQDDLVVEIDPGPVFGSGLHESTRLCLAALERMVTPGCSVIDFGCGSGVLAIAAAKLGAGRVTAVEADYEAVDIARANTISNGVGQQVTVLGASSLAGIEQAADLLIANMTAENIRDHARSFPGVIKPDGAVVVSGMTQKNVAVAEEALASAGLRIAEKLNQGRWIGLVAIIAPGIPVRERSAVNGRKEN